MSNTQARTSFQPLPSIWLGNPIIQGFCRHHRLRVRSPPGAYKNFLWRFQLDESFYEVCHQLSDCKFDRPGGLENILPTYAQERKRFYLILLELSFTTLTIWVLLTEGLARIRLMSIFHDVGIAADLSRHTESAAILTKELADLSYRGQKKLVRLLVVSSEERLWLFKCSNYNTLSAVFRRPRVLVFR